MRKAVYVCEKCNYRGTMPIICGKCGTQLVYHNKENTYCPNCGQYLHGFSGTCDGCGENFGPGEVHFEPLD
jgi:predicted amidophosphoribosyltransferase